MKKFYFLTGIVFFIFATTGISFANLNQFAGTWKNVDANTRGITTLQIDIRGTEVKVQAWGSCKPDDCDWGTVKAIAYAPGVTSDLTKEAVAITAEFKESFKTTLLVIKPARGKMLQIDDFSHFTGGNRTDYHNSYTFKPAPVASNAEDCIGFNPGNARVDKISGSWKIIDGSKWLFDFGNKKGEADKALSIIKHYGMTQSCFVGRPDPSFRYMLVNNNTPAGAFSDEDCISFNPNRIALKKITGKWKIVDGNKWLFDFGNDKAEAKMAFDIIKKYGFTNTCYVGRPDASFEYLRR